MSETSNRRKSPVFWRRFFSMLANGFFDKPETPCSKCGSYGHFTHNHDRDA